MKIPLYQIDAFTDSLFRGNPAAVCPLDDWLDDEALQAIAAENNLSETAFFVQSEEPYRLRWFTPKIEVDLCGHATLAAAHVIFNFTDHPSNTVTFQTRSGLLAVERQGELLAMNFPARPAAPCPVPENLIEGLGVEPQEVLLSRDYLVVYASEGQIKSMSPDMTRLAGLDALGVIVTAPGRGSDFVSRFFAPNAGVPEDPVTGSAHCTLVPYWSARLGRKKLHAFQLSERGGELFCEDRGDRVQIAGHAVTYMEGVIHM